jgi:hypothetical protein
MDTVSQLTIVPMALTDDSQITVRSREVTSFLRSHPDHRDSLYSSLSSSGFNTRGVPSDVTS